MNSNTKTMVDLIKMRDESVKRMYDNNFNIKNNRKMIVSELSSLDSKFGEKFGKVEAEKSDEIRGKNEKIMSGLDE